MQGSITFIMSENFQLKKNNTKPKKNKMDFKKYNKTEAIRQKVHQHIIYNPIETFFYQRGMTLPNMDTKFEVYFRPNPMFDNATDYLYDVKLKGLYELGGTDVNNHDNIWTGEYNKAYQSWNDFIGSDFYHPQNKLVMDFFDTMGVLPILPGCKDCLDGPKKHQVMSDYNYWRRQWFKHGCLHFVKPIDYFWYLMYLFHWISMNGGVQLAKSYWKQKYTELVKNTEYQVITCGVLYSSLIKKYC